MISDGCLLDIRSPETDVIPGVKGAKYVTKYTYPSLSLSLCVCVCVCVCVCPQVWQQQPWLKPWNSRKWNWWPWTTFTEQEARRYRVRERGADSSAGQSHNTKILKSALNHSVLLTEKVWLKVYVFLNLLQTVFNHIKAFLLYTLPLKSLGQ